MKLARLAALAGLASVTLAAPASAATYFSYLEYRDGLSGAQSPYGTVTIQELDANSVKFTVTLTHAASLFVNTGGPHDPFLFNLAAPSTVTFENQPGQEFAYAGDGSYNATPYGLFTDKISCCLKYVPGKKGAPGTWEEGNGASNGDPPPLVFTVYNAGGLTFAGVGATVGADGRLTGLGAGNRFNSNAGGWWFAADIYDGATKSTYNVAARDAFKELPPPPPPPPTGAIPEPGTWALMILGFGAAGAALRQRRPALALVPARR